MREDECDAMWKLYCGAEYGVCIVSSYDRLARLQPGSFHHLGQVRYIDYETEQLTWRDEYSPMMHKRKAFEFEREVRVVSPVGIGKFLLSNPGSDQEYLRLQPVGYRMSCDLEDLIVRVEVSPYATEEFFASIVELTRSLSPGMVSRLKWSGMRAIPSF